jgi:hypothetical protein
MPNKIIQEWQGFLETGGDSGLQGQRKKKSKTDATLWGTMYLQS